MKKVTANIGPAVRYALAGDARLDAQAGVSAARDRRCPNPERVEEA